jgi:hypothetical protein
MLAAQGWRQPSHTGPPLAYAVPLKRQDNCNPTDSFICSGEGLIHLTRIYGFERAA